jgi:hypothetical protein
MGAQRPITIFLISVNSSLCGINFYYYYYYYYLFTAIGFAPGGSSPYTTQLQQNTYVQFCDTSSHRHKTDGQILSPDSCPSSSEYDIAKTINFNYVINEFASVEARKVTLVIVAIVHEKCC